MESDGGGCIVILADHDKIEMDDFLMDNIATDDRYGTKIVTREGNPADQWMLERASAAMARCVVVLTDPLNQDEGTAGAVRTMLALILGLPPWDGSDRKVTGIPGIRGNLMLEVFDTENVNFATQVEEGVRNPFEGILYTLVPDDITGKLLVQCAMEPGLCRVFSHILKFEQNEFYMKEWPSLIRRKFADVCFMFDDAVPFGIRLATPYYEESETPGEPPRLVTYLLNPPGDQVIEDGDEVIVIAEDDDTYSPGEMHLVEVQTPPEFQEPEAKPVNVLLVGFRPDVAEVINNVEKWVAKGSRLMLFCEEPIDSRMEIMMENGLNWEKFQNMTLDNHQGNPLVLADVEALNCEHYQITMILATQLEIEPCIFERAIDVDSRVLVTAVMIRGLQRGHWGMDARKNCTNVAEILDKRSLGLIKASRLNDYVCINNMVAAALAQCAMEPKVLGLLDELFCPDGSEMHIKDIRFYAREGEALNWWELVARARLKMQCAMGYIQQSIDAFQAPVLNPVDKTERIVWRTGDKLVVFSED